MIEINKSVLAQLTISLSLAVVSAVTVKLPLYSQTTQQASTVKRCVSGALTNVVCSGDHVLDFYGNLAEVREIVGPRKVVLVYPIGYSGVADYAGLSPAVGGDRCYDNNHGDAVCAQELVVSDEKSEGRVAELFNNEKAIVVWPSTEREIVSVDELRLPLDDVKPL